MGLTFAVNPILNYIIVVICYSVLMFLFTFFEPTKA